MNERPDKQEAHTPGRTDLAGVAARIKAQRDKQIPEHNGFEVWLYRHESIDVEAALRGTPSATGLTWQQQALVVLGTVRDDMHPHDVGVVQRFLGLEVTVPEGMFTKEELRSANEWRIRADDAGYLARAVLRVSGGPSKSNG